MSTCFVASVRFKQISRRIAVKNRFLNKKNDTDGEDIKRTILS